ncbi:MAG: phosphotransferase [Legionellaceae bacterium]|nr:phosphotransferase [Legionellaceae bacterium]
MHHRQNILQQWLKNTLGTYTIISLTGDASFRQYFRVQSDTKSYILMDAPPEKETLDPFIFIAQLFQDHRIAAPKIYATNAEHGFLLLEDFGDTLLLDTVSQYSPDKYYHQALNLLQQIQDIPPAQYAHLPLFNVTFMQQECHLLEQWLCPYLQLSLPTRGTQLLHQGISNLVEEIAQQPQTIIHRDYHSRNLMIVPANDSTLMPSLGVLDFQDAMIGPCTYDAVSLLKDCYIVWPPAKIERWLRYYYERSGSKLSWDAFVYYFHLSGLQRHIKVLGIFSRLYLRDQKSRYLDDLPRVHAYVMQVLPLFKSLQPLHLFFEEYIPCIPLSSSVRVGESVYAP